MKKVLIANRGEIAVRIIRACRELDIQTVAIYSEADKEALHTQIADEAYCVGPTQSKDSYLHIPNILSIAKSTGCDGIHPGYGFLAENGDFAEMCEACQIKFIGPSYKSIQKMGIKDVAKEEMIKANVPVVPGSDGLVDTVKIAKKCAKKIGYPVIIKATAGGGGKGIRIARDEEELVTGFRMTQQEAETAFGNKGVYLEKFIENFRHIEIQVLGDSFGNVIHLGERDCSIQRRNQKMIEEAPSKALTPLLRQKMGEDAIKAAKGAGYRNAGTIEYVLDQDGNYYFIEMNTRIQVEHPITEMITGVDLIKEQIRIAANQKLTYKQSDIHLNGHAIECRINAENPKEGFRPCPGTVNSLHLPGGLGVRIDTALYQGYKVSSHYDSMIAKVIVHGSNRLEAIRRMRRVLAELVIDGIDTNQELQYLILHTGEYVKGNFDTSFIENNLDKLVG